MGFEGVLLLTAEPLVGIGRKKVGLGTDESLAGAWPASLELPGGQSANGEVRIDTRHL
jgi:hypothetical protein